MQPVDFKVFAPNYSADVSPVALVGVHVSRHLFFSYHGILVRR